MGGGREKAPAAFCRKVLTSTESIEMWGDGKQTRSFTYIDDCVEGILRITKSDCADPLNLGSDEMVSMNGMMEEGLKVTYRWIATQLSSEDAKDVAALAQSKVCSTMAPKALGELRKGDMHD